MMLKSSSPKSLEWHHNLARGYGEIGDYENALIQQKVAVSKSETMLTWHRNSLLESLNS
jgi:hypothetical protein